MKTKLISSSLFLGLLIVNNSAKANSPISQSGSGNNPIEMMIPTQDVENLKDQAEELAEKLVHNSATAFDIIRSYPYSATIKWVYESILERHGDMSEQIDSNVDAVKQELWKMYEQIVNFPYKETLEETGELLIDYPYREKTKEAYLFTKYFASAFTAKLQRPDRESQASK